LNYVERRSQPRRRTASSASAVFAFSVQHPADASTGDEPPYGFEKPYFEAAYD
jgi:hypothetical protein